MEEKSAIKVKSANQLYGTSEVAGKHSELETISFLKAVVNLFNTVDSKKGGL
tara:strand:- start:773 stop:928 length:156 start_codon:yes stop_codon:yes gene_type:complete